MYNHMTYAFWWGIILLCALFSCGGIQMIQEDVGVLQMESFSIDNEEFLAMDLDEKVEEQLSELAAVSGNSFEKLLVSLMLKKQFHPGKQIQSGEVLTDMLGYERLNENAFFMIVSIYEKIFGCVEYLPVASVYSIQKEVLYDAEAYVEDADIVKKASILKETGELKQVNVLKEAGELKKVSKSEEAGALEEIGGMKQATALKETIESEETGESEQEGENVYYLQIPMEETWNEILPVICMKTGTVISRRIEENGTGILCLEIEDGIRILYGNMADFLKDWESGDQIEGGEILGSAAGTGLVIQFQLQIQDNSWHSFNGLPCLQHGGKEVRAVTQIKETQS